MNPEPLPSVDDYVPPGEAARLLGITPKALYRRLAAGRAPELRAVKVFGKWWVPKAAIREAWQPRARHGTAKTLRPVKVER